MLDLKEINFEKYITDYLVDANKYLLRGADENGFTVKDKDYDRALAIDVAQCNNLLKPPSQKSGHGW